MLSGYIVLCPSDLWECWCRNSTAMKALHLKCHQNEEQSSMDYHVDLIHLCETILTELLAIETPLPPLLPSSSHR